MSKFQKYKDLLFSTLAEITSLIIADNDKRLIFRKVLDCCLTVLDVERIYLLEIQGSHIIRYSKSKDSVSGQSLKIESLEESEAIRDWMIREERIPANFERGRELGFDMPSLASRYLGDPQSSGAIMSAPLVAKKSMFGLLVAIHPVDGGLYTTEDVKLFTVLANQAAIALENRQLYQKLEKEAITDALTSVYNYRFLMDSLRTEIKRSLRFKQVFSFVMLDVDNLKQYNDRLGHLWGSQALKEIAAIIVDKCRDIDLVSKYGGDEFGIILPQTEARGAEGVTRRVIEAVAEHKFDGDTEGLLTCSAGVAMFPRDGGTVRELIASADKALYQAKRMGKNKVLTTRGVVTDLKN